MTASRFAFRKAGDNWPLITDKYPDQRGGVEKLMHFHRNSNRKEKTQGRNVTLNAVDLNVSIVAMIKGRQIWISAQPAGYNSVHYL